MLKVTIKTSGRKVTIECDGTTDCGTAKELAQAELNRQFPDANIDLGNTTLYNGNGGAPLDSDTPVPETIVAVKSKNKSA
jgi:hypothetical protein